MSTRSTISIIYNDGEVDSVYCHSDGYLSYNGIILFNYYRDVKKIKDLISLGDLSSLSLNIEPQNNSKHDFDNRQKGVCVFYGRDRGEEDQQATRYENIFQFIEKGNFQEYDYVFKEKNKKWYILQNNKFKLLEPLLKKEVNYSNSFNPQFKKDFLQIIQENKVLKQKKQLEKELETKQKSSSHKL
jgi:hypothetical protein